ncbi:PAS domain S-box protein [Archangium violaceum]|uniref:PAS domain S-box protein n=1 Tax=Archangium violaceum TaxID=83451 RepID=UPI00193C2177|nr:PAS domain S-box protein [Archangium violaceum]QRK12373.1 PAS domain S-box protein [Archangium violaceum]
MSEDGGRAPDFRALFEAAPEPFLVLSPDAPRFTIIAVSDAYLRATLRQRREILGRGLFEVFPDNPAEPSATGVRNLRGSLERVLARREPDAMAMQKYDIPRKEGGFEERFWSPLNTPVLDAHGEVAFIIHKVEDVTGFVRRQLREAKAELERQRARAEAAEVRVSQILERITDAFCSLDTDWRFTYVNEAAQRVVYALGGEGQLLGRSLWEVLPSLKGSRFEREYLRAMREQSAAHFEDFFPPADAWFEIHAYPSPDGLTIVFRDVTARRRAEVRLRSLESVVTNANDAVLITEAGPLEHPGPRIVYVNEGFTRMTGYRAEEVLGQSPRMMQGPGTEREATARIRSALERGEPIQVELLNYKKDGTPFWVEISIAPVLDEQGRLVHFSSVHRDTTERRKAEEAALRLAREEAARTQAEDAERKLTAVLESITDAFFALNEQWRFTYINRRTEELLGRGREELLGRFFPEEFPEAWESTIGRECRRAMREQKMLEFEAFSPTTRRWFLVHAYPAAHALSVYFHDVTERRRMREVLRESELRYRAIFDNSMDAVLLSAPDGRILMANRACSQMLGYTEEELREVGWQAVFEPSDPRLQVALEEWRRSGRFRGELTMKCKDGGHFPVELSSSIFRDGRGAEWTSMFIRDITERKEQERERERLLSALDEERRWLQVVLETVPLGVILIEPGGRVYSNPRTKELFGSAPSANRILLPDGTPVPREQFLSSRVLRTGETILGAEFLAERPDGSRLPILGSAAPIRDAEGRIIGAIGVFQDVSERMKAQEALRMRERLLSGIFEILPIGLRIADATGRIVRFNPAAMRIWGRSGALSWDMHEYKGWYADTGKPLAAEDWPLTRALSKGDTCMGELIRIQGPDGTQKVLMKSVLPLRDEHGGSAGAIAVDTDVTQLKDTEEAIRRAVRSRDDVLGIVAHDLRNPLNGILLQLQRLQRAGTPLEGIVHKALDTIQRQAMRMNHLIRDLLDVTRLEQGTFSLQRDRVSVRELLDEVRENQESIASAVSVDLQPELHGEPPEVWADRDRVIQVLENLIGNSVKFTPPGGRIRVGAARRGDETLFWVVDTGPGIPAEHLPHVFDRFWQASRTDKRGTGLGLAIVKGIIDSHGGRIWVESRVGAGTTFFFTLPVARALESQPGDTSLH